MVYGQQDQERDRKAVSSLNPKGNFVRTMEEGMGAPSTARSTLLPSTLTISRRHGCTLTFSNSNYRYVSPKLSRSPSSSLATREVGRAASGKLRHGICSRRAMTMHLSAQES